MTTRGRDHFVVNQTFNISFFETTDQMDVQADVVCVQTMSGLFETWPKCDITLGNILTLLLYFFSGTREKQQ